MEVLRATPFEHAALVCPLRPPEPSLVLVVKATFELVHQGVARIAAEQVPCMGPVHHDDDAEQSLRTESDFALVKPRGECFVAGACHPPSPPARASAVTFHVGPIRKTIAVFGDREWKRSLLGRSMTEPELFTSMPLRWERAFGGVDANPHGRGVAKVDDAHPLPNLEDPRALIVAPGDRPSPACASPMGPTWPARLAHAGTYDARWKRERFPWVARDFDPAFYLAAPHDQRLRRGFFAGNEEIALWHLVEGQPRFTTRLPSLRPRAFVEGEHRRFEEIPLVLDTISIDADARRASCVWRGHAPVADEKARDVSRLFLMHEPLDAGRTALGCRERMEALLRLREIDASGFKARAPQLDEDARTLNLIRFHEKSLRADPRATLVVEQAIATLMTVLEPRAGAEPPARKRAPTNTPTLTELLAAHGITAEPHAEPAAIATLLATRGVEPSAALAARLAKMEARRGWMASARERALLAYAEGRPLRGDFVGAALAGEDLAELDGEGASFGKADLTGCVLRGAKLRGARLAGARLDGADLSGADLSNADLRGASLREARLDGAVLDGAVIEGAVLATASLRGASLRKVEGTGADLRDAVLEEARADECELTEAVLTGARCRGASFVNARFIGVRADGADLRGCDLTRLRAYAGACFDGADLREAKAERSRWRTSSLRRANFSFAALARGDFADCALEGAVFAGSMLRKARFARADLSGAQLLECDLMKADLGGATLHRADLRGSSLFAAELHRADLSDARLELCDLGGTKAEAR